MPSMQCTVVVDVVLDVDVVVVVEAVVVDVYRAGGVANPRAVGTSY